LNFDSPATWIQELSRSTALHPGDVIEVEISSIGVLGNYVVAEG
jgi:2-keto-4-pentenoate hydratase/2-oxohepta-3-ene-1,7-dioic acid hydratase in catechol pathway